MNLEQKVRTNRLLLIDKAIRSGKYSNTTKLADIAEVTTRTVQRDIEYMRDMYGAPLEYDYTHRGYYYTEDNFYIKGVPLTESELFAMALCSRLLNQYCNTPLEETLNTVFSKIIRCLPDKVSVDTGFLDLQLTFIPDKGGNIDNRVFWTIFYALHKKQSINFEYRSLKQECYTKLYTDPYHVICQRGNWYLLGYCHQRKEPQVFAFPRIRNAVLKNETFSIPADFDPHACFEKEGKH